VETLERKNKTKNRPKRVGNSLQTRDLELEPKTSKGGGSKEGNSLHVQLTPQEKYGVTNNTNGRGHSCWGSAPRPKIDDQKNGYQRGQRRKTFMLQAKKHRGLEGKKRRKRNRRSSLPINFGKGKLDQFCWVSGNPTRNYVGGQ